MNFNFNKYPLESRAVFCYTNISFFQENISEPLTMDDWQLKAMPVVRLERTKSKACVSFLLHVESDSDVSPSHTDVLTCIRMTGPINFSSAPGTVSFYTRTILMKFRSSHPDRGNNYMWGG